MAIKSGQRDGHQSCFAFHAICMAGPWAVVIKFVARQMTNVEQICHQAETQQQQKLSNYYGYAILFATILFAHRPTGIVKLHLDSERNTAINNCYRNDRKGQTDRRWTIGHDEDTGQQIVR